MRFLRKLPRCNKQDCLKIEGKVGLTDIVHNKSDANDEAQYSKRQEKLQNKGSNKIQKKKKNRAKKWFRLFTSRGRVQNKADIDGAAAPTKQECTEEEVKSSPSYDLNPIDVTPERAAEEECRDDNARRVSWHREEDVRSKASSSVGSSKMLHQVPTSKMDNRSFRDMSQKSANSSHSTTRRERTAGITKEKLMEIDDRNSPLHCACFLHLPHHKAEIIRALKCDPDLAKVSNGNGELPLHYACLDKKGVDDRVLDALLGAYPIASTCLNNDRSLPLHLHCMVGAPSLYAVKSLLYANPSAASLQSEFALPSASGVPNNTACGDDSHNLDDDGSFARTGCSGGLHNIHPACGSKADLVDFIDNSRTAFALLYTHKSTKCANDFQCSDHDIPPSYGQLRFDSKCTPLPPQTTGIEQGWSPLHFAALSGANLEVLKVLVEYAPHMVSVKTSCGRTPIDCATSAVQNNVEGAEEAWEYLMGVAEQSLDEC